jgi:hypothetical protein
MIKSGYHCWLHAGLLLLLISLATLSASGCSGYKTFSLEKGIGHFTFEHPAQYKVEKVEVRNDSLLYTHIILSGPGARLEKGGMDYTFIDVFVDDTRVYSRSAEDDLESSLASATKLPDYRLLERSAVSVAGVTAQQVVYFYDRGVRDHPEDPEPEPLPTIMREIYFDHCDLIWSISIRSNEAAAEDARAIFEHILQTFKILD